MKKTVLALHYQKRPGGAMQTEPAPLLTCSQEETVFKLLLSLFS